MRLIDADKLIDDFMEHFSSKKLYGACALIRLQPTIEPERTAKLDWHKFSPAPHCTNCNLEFDPDDSWDNYHYCPNCGYVFLKELPPKAGENAL